MSNTCNYPRCHCPFDMGSDNKCFLGKDIKIMISDEEKAYQKKYQKSYREKNKATERSREQQRQWHKKNRTSLCESNTGSPWTVKDIEKILEKKLNGSYMYTGKELAEALGRSYHAIITARKKHKDA